MFSPLLYQSIVYAFVITLNSFIYVCVRERLSIKCEDFNVFKINLIFYKKNYIISYVKEIHSIHVIIFIIINNKTKFWKLI